MTPERRNSGAREMVIAREWLCKHIHCQTKAHTSHMVTTIEDLLEVVFSVQSMLRLYKGVSCASVDSGSWRLVRLV
jgi:hypothetical protein